MKKNNNVIQDSQERLELEKILGGETQKNILLNEARLETILLVRCIYRLLNYAENILGKSQSAGVSFRKDIIVPVEIVRILEELTRHLELEQRDIVDAARRDGTDGTDGVLS